MTVYKPGEDTYLLLNYLEKQDLEDKKFLDMGTGNGEIALKAAEKGAKVTAIDINSEAIEYARKKAKEQGLYENIEFEQSDLFQDVEDKYDIIAFNPPYLPGKKEIGDEEIWRGGEKGTEITRKFLNQVRPCLRPSGSVFVIASSRAEIDELKEDFDLTVVDEKNIWFEQLQLLKLR